MSTSEPPFNGKWLLISGASSGIGRATAIELVSQGARVVLIGRREAELAETARLTKAPEQTLILPLDLSQLDQIVPRVAELSARIGQLYGLCHCAGTLQLLPLAASTPARISAMMNLNFGAGLELCRALARRTVLEEQGGSIVWIGSVSAHVGSPGQIGYAASKGAIGSAIRSLALELAPRGVRVNCVSPGVVSTALSESTRAKLTAEEWAKIEAMHPLGTGQPQDVARAAVFLLDPRNKWITGADLITDGGYTLH